jgi:hypothetical protein
MSMKLVKRNIGFDGNSCSKKQWQLVGFVFEDTLFVCKEEFRVEMPWESPCWDVRLRKSALVYLVLVLDLEGDLEGGGGVGNKWEGEVSLDLEWRWRLGGLDVMTWYVAEIGVGLKEH